jgi:Vitamin K-dependent gamma-carboxylase
MDQQVDALGFAFFRICYAAILLLELRQLFFFQSLIFPEGVLSPAQVLGLLLAWGMVLCFLMAGWFTRTAAVLNYLISVTVVWGMPDFKYHFDYIMICVNFLLIWLPVNATFSLDADWRKRKTGMAAPEWVSARGVYLLAIVALGLVYLDSVVYKFTSPMWMSGLGFWLPSSLPQNARTDLSWILNQQGLVKAIGYGILVFESLFLLLIWFRPLRLVLVVGGLLLHAGIGLAYPIPHFSLAMMAMYLPLLPGGFWQAVRRTWSWLMSQAIPVRRPSARNLAPAVAGKKAGWLAAFLVYCGLSQLLCLTLTPLFHAGAQKLGVEKQLAGLQTWFKPVFFFNQKFLGLVPHDIFLDKHFEQYGRLVSLRYVAAHGPQVPLPLLDERGQPGPYCTGRLWTKWVYRVTAPQADAQKLAAGLQSFAAFWAGEHYIPLHQARFQVVVKEVAIPRSWQPDHLHRQMRRPWQPVGTLRRQGRQWRLQVPESSTNRIFAHF